jgi:hypothetical protein
MPAYDDLLQSLYATMREEDFEESARAWVSKCSSQPVLYRRLLKLKEPPTDGTCVYLEPDLEENQAPDILYQRIKGLNLNLKALWPAGDYNTIRQAVAEVNWPATYRWSSTGHEVGSATDSEVVAFVVWESFAVPYFNALWCTMPRGKKGTDVPPSVFMFVYSGGGAGVCIEQDGRLVGFTALHCVSYESETPSRCIIMNSLGKVGIFSPTIKNREHDYAFGDLEGLEGIEPAPRLSSTPITTEVVAYGAPSSRADYARGDMGIKWAWMKPIRHELLSADKTTLLAPIIRDVVTKKKRPMTPREWIADIENEGKVWNWKKNYFRAVLGDIEEGAFTSADGAFEHDATLAEGMSGGPIFIEGKLLGIHQGYDDDRGMSLGLRLNKAEERRPAARTAGYRDRTVHDA